MSIIQLLLTYSLPAILVGIVIAIYRERKSHGEIITLTSQFAEKNKRILELEHLLTEQKEKEYDQNIQLNDYIASNAAMHTKLELLTADKSELSSVLEDIKTQYHSLQEEKFSLQNENNLLSERLKDMQNHMNDFEKLRQEHFKSAKEAMFETGTAALRKEAETMTKKTFEGMEHIVKQVASLKDQVQTNDQSVNIIKRALETPGGAGYLSEIGLENTLKGYGLEKERDYKTQFSATGDKGNNLRPDAVVFLPDNHLLVIDSKASKFFIELAELQETKQHDHERNLLQKLKTRMHEHLRTLASKGYKEAVENTLKKEHQYKPQSITTVLFVHTESAIEKILRADPSFRNKATECGIILSGPTGLAGLLSLSSFVIAQERRDQNQQHIIDEISVFLGHISTALDHATKVGKGLESVAKNYNNFTRSVNTRLLPKAQKINNLGVSLPKNKKIPNHINEFHIIESSNSLIEAEAESLTSGNESKAGSRHILESSE